MSDTSITIYHNPKCGTSRNVLEMIKNSGAEPEVVEYLKTPLNAEQLQALLKKLGIPVRDLLRQKGTPYDELSLGKAHWTDEQLIEKMAIFSMSCSSVQWAFPRLSSSYGVPFWRSKSRTGIPSFFSKACNCSALSGVFKYSTTSGSAPLFLIISSTLREVPHLGLW